MPGICDIEVTGETFTPGAVLGAFTARIGSRAGAIVSFSGHVRAEDGRTESLLLQHYPGFTEKSIARMAQTAAGRWDICGLHICHRHGTLAPGEAIVFVAVAAGHRRPAFEAADFLMDYLKTQAPFWKKETGPSGARWINPTAADYAAAKRWGVSGLAQGGGQGGREGERG